MIIFWCGANVQIRYKFYWIIIKQTYIHDDREDDDENKTNDYILLCIKFICRG